MRWLDSVNQHEFDPAPGSSGRQEGLACSGPWGHRVGHNLTTKQQQQKDVLQMLSFLMEAKSKFVQIASPSCSRAGRICDSLMGSV